MTCELYQLGTWPSDKTRGQAAALARSPPALMVRREPSFSTLAPLTGWGQLPVVACLTVLQLPWSLFMHWMPVTSYPQLPPKLGQLRCVQTLPNVPRWAPPTPPWTMAGTVALKCRWYSPFSGGSSKGSCIVFQGRMSYILIVPVPHLCFCSSLCTPLKNCSSPMLLFTITPYS